MKKQTSWGEVIKGTLAGWGRHPFALQPPNTSLVRKSSCLLIVSATKLAWSVSSFILSLPFMYRGQFVNQHSHLGGGYPLENDALEDASENCFLPSGTQRTVLSTPRKPLQWPGKPLFLLSASNLFSRIF